MNNVEIIKIFEDFSKIWTSPFQKLDEIPFFNLVRSMYRHRVIYPNIRNSFYYKLVSYIESQFGETILLLSNREGVLSLEDDSFSLFVMTDCGLYKYHNHQSEIIFSWSSISRVEVDEGYFCFYDVNGLIFTRVSTDDLGFSLPKFIGEEDVKNEINKEIALGFTAMAKSVEPFKYDKYVAQFFNLEYFQRKFIIPINQPITFQSNAVSLFNINNMPQIILPPGHPLPSVMYIGHPIKENVYYPAEDYHMDIIKDRINEFCRVAACLGAKSIDINYEIAKDTKTRDSKENNYGLKGDHNNLELGVEGQIQNSIELVDKLKKTLGTHLEFTPQKAMSLPDELYWYESEEQWKNMYNLRLKNGLTHYSVKMVSNKYNYLKREEHDRIKFGMNLLPVKLETNYSESLSHVFESEENVTISIDVKFRNTRNFLWF